MSILSIRLDPDDMSQDGVTMDAVGSVPALVQRGIAALRDILPHKAPPVIIPKTTEVEDTHGDRWFRTLGGFEMAQIKVDTRIMAGAADLERLFGPLTEITRAGSEGTMYPQRTAQDEGFEPDETDA